ncbi:conserved exported hypothetical protein [Vibrio chagasii]|nr:conserved exported hypothetical protein [Vibrio chagasii]CAH6938845.1 conserved exported hypothetical protein [Vibrio chagasii]CAH7309443.1 conserved exported hypothetical protein [Vibrio chagasii]
MKISKALPFVLMSALLSNTSFAQDVNHSSVVQTVFYDQVDPQYHDSLYLFQLVLSKNCLTYRSEEKPCKDYLKEKYDSVSSDWYQEQEPIKKQYFNIKLEMISNTNVVLADVHHGEQGYFSPIIADTQSIMDARVNPELQTIIRRELSENSGKTGLDFVGAKQQLFVQYDNEAKRFHDAEIEQIDFSSPKPTKAEKIHYQELLFIQKYLSEKLSMTTAERELDKLLKDVIRDIVRCAECATTPIVKTWNNSYVAYKEVSLSEVMLFGLETIPTGNAEVLYPAEYFKPGEQGVSVIEFLSNLRSYIMQNESTLFVSKDKVNNDLKPAGIDPISWEVMKKSVSDVNLNSEIWKKAMVPNIRRLFNSLVKITTGPTGATFVNSASQAMNKAVTTNFKLVNIGKTFNLASAVNAVVKHIPKVVTGESERHLCNSDEIEGSGFTNGITLEELCVYVPNFRSQSFPITVGSLLDQSEGSAIVEDLSGGNTAMTTLYQILPSVINPWEWIFNGLQAISGVDLRVYGQDIMGYRVTLVHDSGAIVYRNIMFAKQELVLSKDQLFDADVSHYTMKVYSNLNNNEVANFALSQSMFDRSYGGVVKGNKFYFVEEIFDNQKQEYVNNGRAIKVCGLPPQNRNDDEFLYECLEDRFYPRIIPDYYMDNMRVVPKPE